jgi:hypothetical protein
MPCYDGGPRGDGVSYTELKEVKDKLDLVTHLLCLLTKELNLDDIKDHQLKAWVSDHREFDKKRKTSTKERLSDLFDEIYKDKLE